MADTKKPEEAKKDKVVEGAELAPNTSDSKGEYREANIGYMKSVFPDEDINDDNYSSMMERTMGEHVMPRMESYNKANDNLKAMIGSQPVVGKILADMSKGASFEELIPRYLDVANMTPAEGDPDYDKWEENNKLRMSEYKAGQDREKLLKSNSERSGKTIKGWFEKNKMDDTAQQEYGTFVAESLDRAYSGDIDEGFLDRMLYAKNYKQDVKKAETIGEIKGKNTKIVEEKMKDEKKQTGDNLPDVTGGASKEKNTAPDNADPLTKGLRAMTKKKPIIKGNSY